MISMLRFFSVLIAFALVACVGGPRNNMIVLSGGIGGTGITAWEGGIGGTGVVGTVTGFGSIIVNGLHINYKREQSVESSLGRMTGASFAVGQVVAAETRFVGGRLEAVRLVLHTPLAGPVQAIDPTAREIQVLGETVHILPGAELGTVALEDLRAGQMVSISGLRGVDGLFASRIDPAQGNVGAVISGTVTEMEAESVIIDGRRTISISPDRASPISIGDFVSFRGVEMQPNGEYRATNRVRYYGPMFDGRVTRMAVEGMFADHDHAVAGVGSIKGVPVGRAVVFVSQSTDGGSRLDGAAARPGESWRTTLSIRSGEVENSGVKPNPQKSTNGNAGRDGGGAGGGTSGGGGGGGGSGSGSGAGGGRN